MVIYYTLKSCGKNMDKLRIYFLGSGEIAVPVLEKLTVSERIILAGVGTQKDRPSGRGRKTMPTPVGLFLENKGIKGDKPDSVNSDDFLSHLKNLMPDMIFVASFGQILKEGILGIPRLGCINLHASLLPFHRGASPINAAILNGDVKTGVSFMRMEKGLDTGPVFRMYECEIGAEDNALQLERKLGHLAAEHVEDIILRIADGTLQAVAQEHARATYAGKIKKEDGLVNWNEDSELIERKVRAYFPWPAAYFNLKLQSENKLIKITKALVRPELRGTPGEFLKSSGGDWVIACGKGALSLLRVIPEGKREMSGADFIRGFEKQLSINNIKK